MEKVFVVLIAIAIFWSAVYYIRKYLESKKSKEGSKGSGGSVDNLPKRPNGKPKK